MAIGYADQLQQTLKCAVVAWSSVDQIEYGIWFERLEHVGDVAADINSRDPISASPHALPDRNDASRAPDQPPISTQTCLDRFMPPDWLPLVPPLLRRDSRRIR